MKYNGGSFEIALVDGMTKVVQAEEKVSSLLRI